MNKRHLTLASGYDRYLDEHGDTHLAVGWPKGEDAGTRYQVMLELLRASRSGRPRRLLDVACGPSHLYEHILRQQVPNIEYAGLDISERFIDLSRRKFPGIDYWRMDVLEIDADALPRFDYAIMNGLFTVKQDLVFGEMLEFLKQVVTRVFALVDVGIAFNVMSKHVDWERDDLFHLPIGVLTDWLVDSVSRHLVVRNDYGLYEYTTYVYRDHAFA